MYKSKISKDTSLELVLLSGDNEGDALKWAKERRLRWPMIPGDTVQAFEGKGGKLDLKGGFPSYFLLSKDGEVLADNKEEVFKLAGLK